jgi:hypothetical protein
MPDVELLDKTELWVVGVTLDDARLPDLTAAAAETLGLPRDRLVVTDVRDDRVVFDVLQPRISLEDVAGRQQELLVALAAVPGVQVSPTAQVHSFGVLGVIGAPPEQAAEILAATDEVAAGVRGYVARRVAVVSTGAELLDGRVHDTNREAVVEVLGAAGYEVRSGGRVEDDERAIAGRVARLVSEGFGIVVTTGGVGAEDKDRTIEALGLLGPDLHTAVLARYEPGHGRHVKDSVRVAVADLGWSKVIALPGPTDEVRRALPVLRAGLLEGRSSAELVEEIAAVIREPLRGTGIR